MALELGPTVFEPAPAGYGHGRIASGLPFVGVVTYPFGPRELTPALLAAGASNPNHVGTDIAPNGAGHPFACPVGGTVVSAPDADVDFRGFSLEVQVDVQYRWGTYHLAEPARDYATGRDLAPGDVVTRGQVVGVVGTTGASTGIHSHLYVTEYRAVGTRWDYIEPSQFFVARVTPPPPLPLPVLNRAQLGMALVDEAHVHGILVTRDQRALANAETYRVNVLRDPATGAPV